MFFMGGGGGGSMPEGFPAEMFEMFGKGKGKGGMMGMDDDEDFEEDGSQASPDKELDNIRLYDLLGVENFATAAEIKKAYHKAAMKHHPDKGGDVDKFKDIQKAFEVLNDPEQRELYDKFGEAGLDEDHPGAGSSPQDLFGQLFGKGGGKGKRGQRPRTKDQTRPMWVTLEEIYTSVTRKLPVVRKVLDDSSSAKIACQACDGDGTITQLIQMGPMVQKMSQQCPVCGGQGKRAKMKSEREVFEVFVEKGSPDGHKITFHGKADEGEGHEPGDLVVVVKQRDHARFMRKGADLYVERDITLSEALTGFRLVIPHLDGRKMIVRSKPGEVVQPRPGGQALKAVQGGGMPIHQDPFQFGNLFIMLSIRFPPSLEPSVAKELRRLLGHPAAERGGGEESGDDVEEVVAEDLDPLESATKHNNKASTAAYEEDSDSMGGRGVECNQQ